MKGNHDPHVRVACVCVCVCVCVCGEVHTHFSRNHVVLVSPSVPGNPPILLHFHDHVHHIVNGFERVNVTHKLVKHHVHLLEEQGAVAQRLRPQGTVSFIQCGHCPHQLLMPLAIRNFGCAGWQRTEVPPEIKSLLFLGKREG